MSFLGLLNVEDPRCPSPMCEAMWNKEEIVQRLKAFPEELDSFPAIGYKCPSCGDEATIEDKSFGTYDCFDIYPDED